MEKNKKKKFRDIRNAVVMMCVMIAMLSTASYAWFTMSSSPTVTGMQMTAASSGGGLMVSNDDVDANFKDAIAIDDEGEVEVLKPVTPTTPLATAGALPTKLFSGPIYTGAKVTGLAEIDNDDAIEGYVAKYTYYIKETTDTAANGTGTVDVGIIIGDVTDSENQVPFGDEPQGIDGEAALMNGSFVRHANPEFATDKTAEDIDPSYAVRVGFVVTKGDGTLLTTDGMYIWEPNADGEVFADAQAAPSDIDDGLRTEEEGYLKLQSNRDGTIEKGGSGNTSSKIFTMDKGTKAKVEMYVWLQGSDENCGNVIQTGSLEAQVQFTVVGDSTTTTP